METSNLIDFKGFAKQIRRYTLQTVYEAKASHIGSALSMVDILAVLYGEILAKKPLNPKWSERDRFLLSKGHACTSLYSTLALCGYFPVKDLETYCKDGSIFLGHTSHHVAGVELSTGSLGHALPVACGLSLAAKRNKNNHRVFVLISDGELDEGSNWEAILFAKQHKLDNLVLIIDYNKIQSLGRVDDIISLEPLVKKMEAFGWKVKEIDGHNYDEIYQALSILPAQKNHPTVIVAHTIKGKGINFMENKLMWHYKSPNEQEYKEALHFILNQ